MKQKNSPNWGVAGDRWCDESPNLLSTYSAMCSKGVLTVCWLTPGSEKQVGSPSIYVFQRPEKDGLAHKGQNKQKAVFVGPVHSSEAGQKSAVRSSFRTFWTHMGRIWIYWSAESGTGLSVELISFLTLVWVDGLKMHPSGTLSV